MGNLQDVRGVAMKVTNLKVTWECDDGYACGSRPHTTEIDIEGMIWMDAEERENHIEECVQEDFNYRVSWHTKILEWPDGKEPDWKALQEEED